jgi:AcrR family transcriptional regulator
LLAVAADAIEQVGPAAMSLRDIARRAGVSHAASTHHFGDKAGLLTALAAEGYLLLADSLQRAHDETGSFLEVGVAYVRFASSHRAHFEVMFRPELTRPDDPALRAAKAAAARVLYGQRPGERPPSGRRLTRGVAAWSLVHGIATLWLNGNLPAELGDDPEQLTRLVAVHLGDDPNRPATTR